MITLRDYQLTGADWLVETKRGLLADGLGVGKSAQAIRALNITGDIPALVLCPTIASINWRDELNLFDVYSFPVHVMLTRKCEPSIYGVTVCPYSLLSDKLLTVNWKTIIADEIHYLKNHKSNRTRFAFGNAVDKRLKTGLFTNVENMYGLSGTPVPNHPTDLWPLLRYLGVYEKSYMSFIKDYCTYYGNHFSPRITGGKNLKRLRDSMSPIMLRRMLHEVAPEVPRVNISHVDVAPSKVDASFNMDEIQEASRVVTEAVLGTNTDDEVIEVLKSLDAPVSTMRRYTALCKVVAAVNYVERANYYGEKIVVFAYHKDVVKSLQNKLKKYEVYSIVGGMSATKKSEHQKGFEASKCGVMIAQIIAAGVAIRFKTANYALFVELDWSPTNNEQALGRCMWQGRTLPMYAKIMSLEKSIDQHVNGVLARKLKTIDAIVN